MLFCPASEHDTAVLEAGHLRAIIRASRLRGVWLAHSSIAVVRASTVYQALDYFLKKLKKSIGCDLEKLLESRLCKLLVVNILRTDISNRFGLIPGADDCVHLFAVEITLDGRHDARLQNILAATSAARPYSLDSRARTTPVRS